MGRLPVVRSAGLHHLILLIDHRSVVTESYVEIILLLSFAHEYAAAA